MSFIRIPLLKLLPQKKMTKNYFNNPIYVLIFLGMFLNACHGQVANKNSPIEKTVTPKPSPKIIGAPPVFAPQPNLPLETDLVGQYIRCIFQDSKGNFWFGPAGGSVARYDEKTLQYYSRAAFFNNNSNADTAFNSVHAIAEDKKGNIWFGTDCGAIKYDGKTFNSYTKKHGLNNLNVGRKSILVTNSGNVWVGTAGGVFQYNLSADSVGGKCFSPFALLETINITGIMEDKTGNIWFASQDNGLFCYDGKTIKNISAKKGLGNNYAGGIIQDETGNFWFTMDGGICKYDGKTFTEITPKDGLGGNEVWGICLEKPGIIWVTARGSTTRLDPSIGISNPKAFTVFTEEDGLNCCVQSMYQDREGNMWWGAGQGLYRFDGKRFYQVKQKGPW